MTHHSHSHKHMDRAPAEKEQELKRAMAGVFKKQKDEALQNLAGIVADKGRVVVHPKQVESVVQAVGPILRDVFRLGGEKALASIKRFPGKPGKKGFDHDAVQKAGPVSVEVPEWMDDSDVLDALEAEEFKFAQKINQTTADALRDELLEGMENGEGIDELKDRVSGLFDDWDGYRAEMIARTESCRAYSKGHVEAWRSTGVVENKVWVAAADACPFCLDMDGTVIPLDDNFYDEGDEMTGEWNGHEVSASNDYSDMEGPPAHPNCLTDMNVPIYTADGWKPIKNVVVGDLVLTHKKRFRKVTKTFKLPTQKMTEIRLTLRAGKSQERTLTVTSDHPILSDGEWITAKDIQVGSVLKMLAGECARCGKPMPYYSKYCSARCCSLDITDRQWSNPEHRSLMSRKISAKNLEQYADGTRERDCWKKGRAKLFRLVAQGVMPWPLSRPDVREKTRAATNTPEQRQQSSDRMRMHNPSLIPEVRARMTASYAKTMQEHPERHPNVIMAQRGFSSSIERRMKKLLEQARIPFVQQQPILRYFADFAIPELKIAIECDGHYWHNLQSKKEQKRQREIEAEGWTVVRFTEDQINKQMDEVADKVLRIAANHSGRYNFLSCQVVRSEVTRRKCATLYNLSVEEDESFVAKGIVVHNCRCALVGQLSEEKALMGNVTDASFEYAVRNGAFKSFNESQHPRSTDGKFSISDHTDVREGDKVTVAVWHDEKARGQASQAISGMAGGMHGFHARDKDGVLHGATSYSESRSGIHIQHIGSKIQGAGAGTALVTSIEKLHPGKTLIADPVKSSEDFWLKSGFKKNDVGLMIKQSNKGDK